MVFCINEVVLLILNKFKLLLLVIDISMFCVFFIEVFSNGELMVILVVLSDWFLFWVELMFISVVLVLDMMFLMLVKLMLIRFGVVIRLVMFCMLLSSILLVLWKVFISDIVVFFICSNWLLGIMMRVL